MAGKTRQIFSFLAILALLVVLALGLSWWSMHTAWFSNLLRARVIGALEKTTGRHVELRSFSLNPDTLHARLTGLVIHGTEPAGSAPLLSVASAEVAFTIQSVFLRSVNLQSVEIDHPEINLLLNSDGSTNIPLAKHRSKAPLEQLLDLKIKHLAVQDGFMQLFSRRLPFHFESQEIGLLLQYDGSGPSYGVSLQTKIANMALQQISFHPMNVKLNGRLFKNHADIQELKLVTDKNASTIELAGQVEHFGHAAVDARVKASLSIDELAQLPKINEFLRDGRGSLSGNAHFEADTGQFTFHGKAHAQGVDFVTPPFTLRNMEGEADIIANNGGMLLRHVVANARGAKFWGEGSIKNYSFLEVDANFAQLALKEVGTYFTKQSFPWSGTGHGFAHMAARLTGKQPDFNIKAKAEIDAGTSGIPMSGNVDVSFDLRTRKVEFGDSVLHLPHSSASFKGSLDSDLSLTAESSDVNDLEPLIPILQAKVSLADLPRFMSNGHGRFDGALHDLLHQPLIIGNLALQDFRFREYDWESLNGQIAYSANSFSFGHIDVRESGATLSGEVSGKLSNWMLASDSPLDLRARFSNLDVARTAALLENTSLPSIRGIASGNVHFQGTLNQPHGQGSFQVANLDAYGQQLNRVQFDAALDGNQLRLDKGRLQSGPALLSFSGDYRHAPADWRTGDVDLAAETNGFPLASLASAKRIAPALNARAEIHFQAAGRIRTGSFEPAKINGSVGFTNLSLNGRQFGNASLSAFTTQGSSIDFKYSGELHNAKFQGSAQARLTPGTPIRGDLQLARISFASLRDLVSESKLALPVDGYLDGSLAFDGPLQEPSKITATASIKELQISSLPNLKAPDIVLRNNQPISMDVRDGELNITSFEIDGRDTSIKLSGSAPLSSDKPMNVRAEGKVDLALFAMFDPNVRSAGSSELAANITGTIASPNVNGSLQVHNASLFFADLPNGLSDVNGSVVFGRNRAIIQSMNGHSGGGDISLGGSISFGEGTPVVYQLEAAGHNVRVRYANTISVTANSDLRLSGTSASSILSGVITVSRVVFTPSADAGNLLTAAVSSSSAPADQGDFISGLHLDLTVESAPNLQVSTNLSRDVEAEIQLRLRGTPEHPIVLGAINANQGDLRIFGTRFSLNRGEVSFVNSVRTEPVLDLDLQTEARGVTVDITVSGTPSKLNFNYRSDPPLQPRDIIALLTVGRAPNVGTTGNAQTGSDVSALSSGVNSVLGQAISPVSNRLSKLFGITNIKIDPFTQGITNTPQARLSVEQQVSRNVTVTYVTNLSQTSEQIFRFELALTRQFSIVALRDDNGEFGIDFQIKKRFK